MITGRRRSVILFTVVGICLVAIAVALNVSWVVLNWKMGVLAILGVIFFLVIIAGMVVYTISWFARSGGTSSRTPSSTPSRTS